MPRPLLLASCILTLAKFGSTPDIRADRNFAFTYVGEVQLAKTETPDREGADADASSVLDGTLALTTDATIVSQNQEDGVLSSLDDTKKIVWKANSQTKEAPLAVLQVALLP